MEALLRRLIQETNGCSADYYIIWHTVFVFLCLGWDFGIIVVHKNNHKLDIKVYQVYIRCSNLCSSIIAKVSIHFSMCFFYCFHLSFASSIHAPFLSLSLIYGKVFHTSLISHALTFHYHNLVSLFPDQRFPPLYLHLQFSSPYPPYLFTISLT